jgi:hypothetical protein
MAPHSARIETAQSPHIPRTNSRIATPVITSLPKPLFSTLSPSDIEALNYSCRSRFWTKMMGTLVFPLVLEGTHSDEQRAG